MIRQLRLHNFKCFKDLNLPLAPATLLAGLNGMGKSSVVQAMLLLYQSFESGDLAAGRLLLCGDFVDLGSGVDVLYEDADDDAIEIGLKVERKPLLLEYQFRFIYDRKSDRLQEPDVSTTGADDGTGRLFAGGFSYLSAERLGPRKTLPLSESRVRKADIGVRGEYFLHLLLEHGASLLPENDPRLRDAPSRQLADQVDAWLQEASPGSHLDFEAVRAADIAISGFKFDRPGDVQSRRFRATNVGFGLSYSLPVIVALLSSKPSSTVIIENPEAHLHPKGQTRLGQLAARTAAAGVQVIIETHSDHFMDGLRIDVHDGRLAPDKAAIHYFVRKGIEASVQSPTIDNDGRLSEWPEGFFDQYDQNLARLLAPRS
jgi:predicted ATPase